METAIHWFTIYSLIVAVLLTIPGTILIFIWLLDRIVSYGPLKKLLFDYAIQNGKRLWGEKGWPR